MLAGSAHLAHSTGIGIAYVIFIGVVVAAVTKPGKKGKK